MTMPPRRAGFSLLEVLLATGILLGSMFMLYQLAHIGRRHANKARDLAAAQLACQTRLNEILAGVAPLETAEGLPLEDPPGWLLSVELQPVEQTGLAALRVTVCAAAEEDQRKGQFSLVRKTLQDHYRLTPTA